MKEIANSNSNQSDNSNTTDNQDAENHKGGMVCVFDFDDASTSTSKKNKRFLSASNNSTASSQQLQESPSTVSLTPKSESVVLPPSFYEMDTILKETENRNTGHWKLIYRERVEQVQCNARCDKMIVKGTQIAASQEKKI